MLTKFCVENFRAFPNRLEFNLAHPGNYEFNTDVIQNGSVSKAMVYGFNGCGKSSLGLAMLDITTHLTDNQRIERRNATYRNLDSAVGTPVSFEYSFCFDGTEVVYSYQKENADTLLNESLRIGKDEVIRYDFANHFGFVRLEGTETLRIESSESNISRVKYVNKNAILKANPTNELFRSNYSEPPGKFK